MGEERPEEVDSQHDLAALSETDGSEGNAFSEPYDAPVEEDTENDVWTDTAQELPMQSQDSESSAEQAEVQDVQASAHKSPSWSSVLYRFLTNRKTEDGFMLSKSDHME